MNDIDFSPDEMIEILEKAAQSDKEAEKIRSDYIKRSDSYAIFLAILERNDISRQIRFICLNTIKNIVTNSEVHRKLLQRIIYDYIDNNYQYLYTVDFLKNCISDLFVIELQDAPDLATLMIDKFISGDQGRFILGIEFATNYIQKTHLFDEFNSIFSAVCRILNCSDSSDLNKTFCIQFISMFTKELFQSKLKEIPSFFRNQISIISITVFFSQILRVPPQTGRLLINFIEYLAQMPPITFIPSFLGPIDEETLNIKHIQSISEIIENINIAFGSQQITFEQFGDLADLSTSISQINVVERIEDRDLICNFVNSILSALNRSISKDSLIINNLIAEKLFNALYHVINLLTETEIQEFFEKTLPDLIQAFYSTLFEQTTDQNGCLYAIYENDTSYSLFNNFSQILIFNYQQNIGNLIEIINDLASNKNIGIAACIEIGCKLMSNRSKNKNHLPSENIKVDVPLITTVAGIVANLEPLVDQFSFSATNNPKIWLELALVHFFVSVQKIYLNTVVGRAFFSQNPSIFSIFFSRILFDLSSEDIDFQELNQMVSCLNFDSFPDEVINEILSNEEIMKNVVSCHFPFIFDENLDDQSKALYRTLFSIANRCKDESVLSAILQSNIPRLDNPQLVKCTLDSLLGFFETRRNIEYTLNFFVEAFFPKIIEISNLKENVKNVSEFCLKYSQIIEQSDDIECLSELAMTQFKSFSNLFSHIVKISDSNEKSVMENLTSSVYNMLKWKCVNYGVLHLYGNKDIFGILVDYFTKIFSIDIEKIIKDHLFLFKIVDVIVESSYLFHQDLADTPLAIRISFIDFMTISISLADQVNNMIDSICSSVQSCFLDDFDIVTDENNCLHKFLVSLIFLYVRKGCPDRKPVKETIYDLIKVDNDFLLTALSSTEMSNDENREFVVSLIEYIHNNKYNENVWNSLNTALKMIVESVNNLD